MKKTIFAITCLLLAGIYQPVQAQSIFSRIFGSSSTSSTTNNATAGKGGEVADVISNIIGVFTGKNTNQASLIGTWSYTKPRVQFESNDLLTQAGGAVAAEKVEKKLTSIYKKVGITEGRMTFTFQEDGKVIYTMGSRKFQGTYTFDDKEHAVNITTASGRTLKAYVTVTPTFMSLCFDSTKALQLFTNISSKFNTSISTLAGAYDGMKTGFEFSKQ